MKELIEELKNSIAGFGSLSSSESLKAVEAIEKLEQEKFMLEQDIEVYVHAGNEYEKKLEAAIKFINGIKIWSECYPEEIFKEPDPKVLHEICKEAGTTLDAISAMVLRRYTKTWGEKAVKVLSKIEGDNEE